MTTILRLIDVARVQFYLVGKMTRMIMILYLMFSSVWSNERGGRGGDQAIQFDERKTSSALYKSP